MAYRELPENYHIYQQIDILNDQKHLKAIMRLSVIMLILSLIPLIILICTNAASLSSKPFLPVFFKSFFLSMLPGIILTIPCLALHELMHGILMHIFSKNKVTYGFNKTGFLYAITPNIIYTRPEFVAILLFPMLLLNITLLFLIFSLPLFWGLAVFWVFVIHFSGCAGDLYYWNILLNLNNKTLIRDTETGIIIYK